MLFYDGHQIGKCPTMLKLTPLSFSLVWGKSMEDCKIVVGFWQLAAGDWPLVKCGLKPLPEEGEKMRG